MKYFVLSIIVLLAACDANDVFVTGYNLGSSMDTNVICTRQNQIISAKLAEESKSTAYIEVEYFYDNSYGPDASIHIKPIYEYELYWSHEAIKPMLGHHKVIVELKHPGRTDFPDVIDIKKAEIMLRVQEHDKQRNSYFTHKLSSSFFELEKMFYKPEKG